MKKTLLLLSAFAMAVSGTFAQQYEVKKELSFSFGPSASRFRDKNLKEDDHKTVDDKNGYNFDLLYTRYLRGKGLGLSLGIGYSSYSQVAYQKGLFENFSQKDKDGNIYDEWLDSDITYTNKLSTLDVPVFLHFLFGKSDNYDGFFDLGVLNQFKMNGENTEKGSLENMGKYANTSNPYFNYVSQNNSYYDYHVEYFDKKSDRYNRYSLAGHVAAGLSVKMTERTSFKAQTYVNIGLTDATAKEFRDQDYVNVFGLKKDYEKTKLFAAGLSAGFVIRLGE
jgi:hypothetical protein